jgi:hypothetical protein
MRPSRSLLPPFLPKKVSYKIYQAIHTILHNIATVLKSYLIQIELSCFGNHNYMWYSHPVCEKNKSLSLYDSTTQKQKEYVTEAL